MRGGDRDDKHGGLLLCIFEADEGVMLRQLLQNGVIIQSVSVELTKSLHGTTLATHYQYFTHKLRQLVHDLHQSHLPCPILAN